jgi:biopolymer transport protein ExbB/TolQ
MKDMKIIHYLVCITLAVLVHIVYQAIIIPGSLDIMSTAESNGQTLPRHFLIIIKDLEQEICIILFLIGLYLMTYKIFQLNSKKYLFKVDFLEDIGSSKVSGEKAILELEKLPQDISSSPLIETLKASLRRYMITANVQNTSDAINVSVNNLALKLDSENTMIRYLIWAIPSLGFVGTVRGIGQALSNADKALAGDISGMAQSLGVAFNSTFVALLISLVLMLVLNLLQKIEDDLLINIQSYSEKFLLNRISRT